MNHGYDALLQYLCAEKIRCGKLRALLLQPEQSLDRRQLHLLAVDRSPSHLRSHQFLHAIAHLPIFSNSPSSQFIQTLTVDTISNPSYGKAEGGLQTLPAFVSFGPDSEALPSGLLTLLPCFVKRMECKRCQSASH